MMNNVFPSSTNIDLSPKDLQDKINDVYSWLLPTVINGVDLCGFAQSQEVGATRYN